MNQVKRRLAALGAVIALAGVGRAAAAPQAGAAPLPPPPPPPDPVGVRVVPMTGVEITWPHSDAYLLHNYGVSDGVTEEFVPASSNTFVWEDISPGERKCFRVSIDTEVQNGSSDWSEPACITMPN
ncbi:hypothetical protein GCM10010377_09130 [Streptomyces viridiviolaceus]|uniref:Fibronectin type-III domain-containing protein n=1 Tax=Streptomyces viridiviolaceus TaxID=68282 RepID=A0ABW2EB59_9ACTN|nr:hypothetical protein [Streptomyces viridiviolaceus]GHB21581.1 hypothetical protein GCM10010377_09130 [Streptomyces viridiviolaceus]